MGKYVEGLVRNTDFISIDSEAIISELNKGNFTLSTTAGTYANESLTYNYINSIFEAVRTIEESYKDFYNCANSFMNAFEEVPEPEYVPGDTSYLL